MKRIIKEFKSTPSHVLALISEQYPYGYDDTHLVNFMNAKGEYQHAIEVKTEDTVYLIKLDRHLDQHFSDFLSDEDETREELEFDEAFDGDGEED